MPKLLKLFPNGDVKEKYLIGLIIGFVFILNFQKLHLYFLSDDFTFIGRFQHLKDVFMGSATYHVNPVPQFFIFYLGNRLAGFNPLYYHSVTLLLHTVNVVLVFTLAQVLFRNKWTSAAASLMFATFPLNYEVVNWITGVFYILLAVFYISALLFFMRYLDEPNKKYYALFIVAFTFAVFTMEQGVTLLGACVLCEIFIGGELRKLASSPWKQRGLLLQSVKKYLPPVAIIASFFILKHSMKQGFVVNTLTFGAFMKTSFGMIWHLFILYPYGINNGIFYETSRWNYRVYLILLGLMALSYFLVKKFRQQHIPGKEVDPLVDAGTGIYLFLLGCILVYVIPHSIATIIQARYFYLPSVFSSIILGRLLLRNLSQIVASRGYMKLLFHATIVFFLLMSLPINVIFLNNEYTYWMAASRVTRNIINDTKQYLSDGKESRDLYFVNLPDGIYGNKGFGWPDAYVFRNGIYHALKMAYPTKEINVVRECRTKDPKGIVTWHEHELVAEEQLDRLAEDKKNIVLIYDADKETIKKLTPRPPM